MKKDINPLYIGEKEISAMSGLYQLGSATVGKLAKHTLINRTSLYPILEGLLSKGLVSKLKKEEIIVYQPISLKEFNDWIKRQTNQITSQAEKLVDWIKFQQIQEKNSLISEIKYFEGFEGIKNLYNDSWRNNPEKIIYAITDYKKAYRALGEFFNKDYFIKRINHGIKVINLLPESAEGKRDIKTAQKMLREMKFVKLFENLGIEINIYASKVSIVTFNEKNPSGVLIKNDLIAKAFKNIFEYLWKNN